MNHFTTDDRYFAKHYTKYGVIPTDEELPYKASDNSASGKYVHPDEDNNKGKSNKHMKQKQNKQIIKLNESQLRNFIKESIKKVLNEAVDDPAYMLGHGWSKTISLEPIVEYSNPMLDRELFQELVRSGLAQEDDDINDVIFQFMNENFMPRLQAVYNKAASKYDSWINHDAYNNNPNLKLWELYVSSDRYSDDIDEFFIKHLLNSINTISQEGSAFAVAGKMAKQALEEFVLNESQLRNIIKESIKKVLKENYQKHT